MPTNIPSDLPKHATNFFADVACNATGGAIGAFAAFPWESLKKRLQSGELTPTDFRHFGNGKVLNVLRPKELYRGSGGFCGAVMAATASSMMFNKIIHEQVPFYDAQSHLHQGAAAMGSGMLGAIVGSTPVENMLLVQQKYKIGPHAAAKRMLQQGIFRPWVGLRELMVREAGFAGVMLFAGPAARNAATAKTNNETAGVVAEIGVGLIGALATHPADTIATIRQKSNGDTPLTNAIQNIYAQDGMKGFFKGAASRMALFIMCATIIPRAVNRLQLFQAHFQERA